MADILDGQNCVFVVHMFAISFNVHKHYNICLLAHTLVKHWVICRRHEPFDARWTASWSWGLHVGFMLAGVGSARRHYVFALGSFDRRLDVWVRRAVSWCSLIWCQHKQIFICRGFGFAEQFASVNDVGVLCNNQLSLFLWQPVSGHFLSHVWALGDFHWLL